MFLVVCLLARITWLSCCVCGFVWFLAFGSCCLLVLVWLAMHGEVGFMIQCSNCSIYVRGSRFAKSIGTEFASSSTSRDWCSIGTNKGSFVVGVLGVGRYRQAGRKVGLPVVLLACSCPLAAQGR